VIVETSGQGAPVPSLRTATLWSYGLTLGRMGIATGLSLVLAAMLGPRVFGVIAMALVFINFIEILQQQGLMPAIIARKILRAEHADTAFWLVIGVGVICTTTGIAIAPLWAGLNNLSELAPVIQILALGVPLMSSVVVHEAMLRRNLEFKKLAMRSWIAVLAGGAAGIAGALLGWGVWALVAQQLVMNITAVAVLWGVSSWRPRFRFERQAARELLTYSWRATLSSFGLFIGGRVDVVLAGAFFGPALVGIYQMGQRLATMVVDVTARSMQSVSLPALAALQRDEEGFETRLLGMQRLTSSLTLPTLGVLVGVAPVVEHILGAEWEGATTAIRLMAVTQGLSAISLLLGPALQARGRPGTLAAIVWVWSATTVAALVTASIVPAPDGVQGRLTVLCVAVIAATGTSIILMIVAAGRCFDIAPTRMLRASGPGAAAGAASALVAASIMTFGALHPLPLAAVAAAAGMVGAGAVLALLDPFVRNLLRRTLRLRRLPVSGRSTSSVRSPARSKVEPSATPSEIGRPVAPILPNQRRQQAGERNGDYIPRHKKSRSAPISGRTKGTPRSLPDDLHKQLHTAHHV
jgi:PST family polysaccharide transporter